MKGGALSPVLTVAAECCADVVLVGSTEVQTETQSVEILLFVRVPVCAALGRRGASRQGLKRSLVPTIRLPP